MYSLHGVVMSRKPHRSSAANDRRARPSSYVVEYDAAASSSSLRGSSPTRLIISSSVSAKSRLPHSSTPTAAVISHVDLCIRRACLFAWCGAGAA